MSDGAPFLNAFIGKTEPPAGEELAKALGPAAALWDHLVAEAASAHGVDLQEWNSYSKKAGWALRLKRDKRAIVYLSPGRECFLASFALGARALEVARAAVPRRFIKMLDEAKRYAEGTAVRIEVRKPFDIEVVRTLIRAKVEN